MKLTAEQSTLVAENHNLIFWYINSRNLELNEYYDLLALELCYTIMNYNPERGSLGNYFKLRADGVIAKEYRKTQAQKRLHVGVPLLDNLHSIGDTEDVYDTLDLTDWINGDEGEILRLKAKGYNQTEVAEMLGMSQSFVSKILKKKKKEYLERR